MSDRCCAPARAPAPTDPGYRRVLWAALVINIAMFGVETTAGLAASSVSLLADAIDFFGDAANYALALLVLGLAPLWRSRAALIKAATMAGYGVFVLGKAGREAAAGTVPEPVTMGAVALLALAMNVLVALLLYRYRAGDADMRSVGTNTGWPDFAVAAVMGSLALTAGYAVLRQARAELRASRSGEPPASAGRVVPVMTPSADTKHARG